jgi:hypothetical protein
VPSSPGLRGTSYPGEQRNKYHQPQSGLRRLPRTLKPAALVDRVGDTTRFGVDAKSTSVTRGSSFLPSSLRRGTRNPGLCDGIPLGFSELFGTHLQRCHHQLLRRGESPACAGLQRPKCALIARDAHRRFHPVSCGKLSKVVEIGQGKQGIVTKGRLRRF